MKKLLIVAICLIGITTGCLNKNSKYKTYTSLSYSEYEEKLNKEDTFLLFLWQTGCSHCEDFEPKLKDVIAEYNLEVYGLNLADLSEDEYAKVKNKTFISGTPTLVYLKNGKNEEKLVGDKSKQILLDFLTKIGYIKEN